MKLKSINNHLPSTVFDQQCSGPCIIIGSGPSQNELLTNKDWNNYYTMSVNWSQMSFPSQIYFWQDASLISQSKAFLNKKQFLGCSILPTSKVALGNQQLMQGLGGIYIDRTSSRERPDWIDTKKSDKIQCCSPISGAIAICMAYVMGFSPIVLVGFDCNDGEYAYLKKHPQFGYFNKRAARKHAHTQVRLLKNFGHELGVVNCSQTEAITRYNFKKTVASLGESNKTKNQSIIKEVFIDKCKKNGLPFINQWKKKIPL